MQKEAPLLKLVAVCLTAIECTYYNLVDKKVIKVPNNV